MKQLIIGLSGVLLICPAVAAESSRLAGSLPGKRDTGRTIVLSADVSCAPDKAFMMWSTPKGAQFFAPRATIGDQVGGPYTVAFFPDEDPKGERHGTAGAHVLAREPGKFLAFEWVTFAGDDTKGRNAPPYAAETLRRPNPLPTWVELTFSPAKRSGTHVEFRHYGFGDSPLWQQSQTWFTGAWTGVLAQMNTACGN